MPSAELLFLFEPLAFLLGQFLVSAGQGELLPGEALLLLGLLLVVVDGGLGDHAASVGEYAACVGDQRTDRLRRLSFFCAGRDDRGNGWVRETSAVHAPWPPCAPPSSAFSPSRGPP